MNINRHNTVTLNIFICAHTYTCINFSALPITEKVLKWVRSPCPQLLEWPNHFLPLSNVSKQESHHGPYLLSASTVTRIPCILKVHNMLLCSYERHLLVPVFTNQEKSKENKCHGDVMYSIGI